MSPQLVNSDTWGCVGDCEVEGKSAAMCVRLATCLSARYLLFLELSTPSHAVWVTLLSQSPRVTACYFFLPSTLPSVQSLWVLTCASVCPDRSKTHTIHPHKLLLVGVVL